MSRDKIAALLETCRVSKRKGFRLKNHDPAGGALPDIGKAEAESLLREQVERLAGLQDMLYAQDRWAVLALFQAMDAAGKDGAIKHVFSGLNPQGCQVEAFKAPTATELDHDFLWRHVLHLPQRGRIGIHNRSWYEEVLVARVHPEVLARQRLPTALVGGRIWEERLEDIAAFERYLARQGVVVMKFFLNISKEEQKKRFLARIAEPEKNWKFNAGDIAERRHWKAYQAAYEEAIRATATPASPWFVIPADRKWLTRLLVVEAMLQALEGLELHYPHLAEADRQALERARAELA